MGSRAPPVLTCHLKRFNFTYRQGRKINKHVEFSEHLDLAPYMSASQVLIPHLRASITSCMVLSSKKGYYGGRMALILELALA